MAGGAIGAFSWIYCQVDAGDLVIDGKLQDRLPSFNLLAKERLDPLLHEGIKCLTLREPEKRSVMETDPLSARVYLQIHAADHEAKTLLQRLKARAKFLDGVLFIEAIIGDDCHVGCEAKLLGNE